jgi:hypothetical protein
VPGIYARREGVMEARRQAALLEAVHGKDKTIAITITDSSQAENNLRNASLDARDGSIQSERDRYGFLVHSKRTDLPPSNGHYNWLPLQDSDLPDLRKWGYSQHKIRKDELKTIEKRNREERNREKKEERIRRRLKF